VSCLFVADLARHFADEEAYLFTQLSPTDPMRLRAEQEHAEMRSLVDTIRRNGNDTDSLFAFAKLLEAHIRFEERELFARLQESLSSGQLLQLLRDVPARPHLNDADWDDAFWTPNGQTRKETSHAG
jgi:hemerythrin-like domain-containing protein